jgi:hypothetical protein
MIFSLFVLSRERTQLALTKLREDVSISKKINKYKSIRENSCNDVLLYMHDTNNTNLQSRRNESFIMCSFRQMSSKIQMSSKQMSSKRQMLSKQMSS